MNPQGWELKFKTNPRSPRRCICGCAPKKKRPRTNLRSESKPCNATQLLMRTLDVEHLVGPDHPARAIWEVVGTRDLQPFYEKIKAVETKAGRPPHDPLISVWLYSYTQGIASGREIEERCGYDPAYLWLTGAAKVCAHSLTDFRTAHGAALKDLSIQ